VTRRYRPTDAIKVLNIDVDRRVFYGHHCDELARADIECQ
jgi:hypothetical protein